MWRRAETRGVINANGSRRDPKWDEGSPPLFGEVHTRRARAVICRSAKGKVFGLEIGRKWNPGLT